MNKNKLGYISLSDRTLRKVMGIAPPDKEKYFSEGELEALEIMLEWNGVPTGEKKTGNEFTDDESIADKIPSLLAKDIRGHFECMAIDLLKPWQGKIDTLACNDSIGGGTVPSIVRDTLQGGWNRFTHTLEGGWSIPTGVLEILEDYAVFDTETFVKGTKQAHVLLATAVNHKAMYLWVHPQLLDNTPTEDYLPLLPSVGKGKLLVAHNSAYDYPRVKESYSLDGLSGVNSNAFLCTMSMNKIINGLDSSQLWAYRKKWEPSETKPSFYDHGCPGSLIDCYNYHVAKKYGLKELVEADKKIRKAFVDIEDLNDFRKEGFLEDLCKYALMDVVYTHHLFIEIYPKYLVQTNSLVLLACDLYHSVCLLPIADDWYEWVENTSNYVGTLLEEASNILTRHSQLPLTTPVEVLQQDTWFKYLKGGNTKRKFTIPDSTTKKNAAFIMKLKWDDNPIVEEKGKGFGYYDGNNNFVRLPHPDGKDANVGNVFANFFWNSGRVTSEVSQDDYNRLCEIQWLTSFWISIESRVKSKFVEPIDNPFSPTEDKINVMPLNLIPRNTITGRTGENTWYTTASHAGAKCGAEIRGKVVAPKGSKIISFDLASQELNILSAYGASYLGISGSTAFDYTNIVGDKKNRTDLHSMVADSVGAERDATKSANYAVMYGAEKKTVSNSFMKFHPDLDKKKVLSLSIGLLKKFKGEKNHLGLYQGGIASETFNIMRDMLTKWGDEPYTTQFGVKMSKAITPKNSLKTNSPSQLNWLVQGAGSSMLSGLVVAIVWLMKYYKIRGRLLITFFDEIVLLVDEEQAELTTWICQVAHCWSWSCIHYQLGTYDLPCNRAWLDGISIDFTWRKSPKEKYKTPTFPGYSPGKEITMQETIKDVINFL